MEQKTYFSLFKKILYIFKDKATSFRNKLGLLSCLKSIQLTCSLGSKHFIFESVIFYLNLWSRWPLCIKINIKLYAMSQQAITNSFLLKYIFIVSQYGCMCAGGLTECRF